MSLISTIEEFQKIMQDIVSLTEEARLQANQLPDVPIGEAPEKITEILEICNDGMSYFKKASNLAEEIEEQLR